MKGGGSGGDSGDLVIGSFPALAVATFQNFVYRSGLRRCLILPLLIFSQVVDMLRDPGRFISVGKHSPPTLAYYPYNFYYPSPMLLDFCKPQKSTAWS